jgi:hypothetical protein
MIKFILFLFGLFCFITYVTGQSQDLASFIPADYSILDSASGDINKDGKKDLIVILKNNLEEINGETTRPLLILVSNEKGSYNLSGRNDSVVLCKACGGVFGDPYAGMTVKNNFFSIEHYGGSNWRWTRIITFRYDPKSKQVLLHRDAGDSFHTSDPDKTTTSIYNKEDFGKLSFAGYSCHKGW